MSSLLASFSLVTLKLASWLRNAIPSLHFSRPIEQVTFSVWTSSQVLQDISCQAPDVEADFFEFLEVRTAIALKWKD